MTVSLSAWKWGRALGALLLVSFLASCATTDPEVARQGDRIDDLQVRMLRLERAVEEGLAPASDVATAPPVPADLTTRVAELGQQVELALDEIRSLQGRLDAVQRKPQTAASAVGTETTQLRDLEAKVAGLADRLAGLEARSLTAPVPAAQPAVVPSPGVAAVPPTTPQAPPTRKPSAQELYDRAYGLYKQGKYEEAREAFHGFTELHPETNLTDNAHFWIGESYYDQGKYEQAILEYDKVVQKFPSGDKVASALLKQAFAFDAIGDPVDARILLRKLLREHPASEQAAIAKKKLEILGE